MKISRVRLALETDFWDEEREDVVENLLKLYKINREDIIGVSHGGNAIYLYYVSNNNGGIPDAPPAEVKQRPCSADREAENNSL